MEEHEKTCPEHDKTVAHAAAPAAIPDSPPETVQTRWETARPRAASALAAETPPYMHTHMAALAQRVTRPRGTGSVGDSVGEGADAGMAGLSEIAGEAGKGTKERTDDSAPRAGPSASRGPSASGYAAAEASPAGLEQRAASSRHLPSPTLSPTDPVPRRGRGAAREPSPPPSGIFICEFKCGFSGTYQQVALHELTHAKPPLPARRVSPNAAAAGSPSSPTQSAQPPSRFQCEFRCGFIGAYGEVQGHEKTCTRRPPDVADFMSPRNVANFTPPPFSPPALFERAGAAETGDGGGEDGSVTGVGPDTMGTFAGDCTEDLMSEIEESLLSSRSLPDSLRDVGLVVFGDDLAPVVHGQDTAASAHHATPASASTLCVSPGLGVDAGTSEPTQKGDREDKEASFDASLSRLIDKFKGKSDDEGAAERAAAERDADRAAAVTAASLLGCHTRSAASARLTQALRQASPRAPSPKLAAEISEERAAGGQQREAVRKSSDQAPVRVKVEEEKLGALARGGARADERSVARGSVAMRGKEMGASQTLITPSQKVEAALSLSYASRVSDREGGDDEGASFIGFLADLKAGNRRGAPDAEHDSVRTLEKLRRLKQRAATSPVKQSPDVSPAPLRSPPGLMERRAPQREESEAAFQDVLNHQALNRNRRLGRMGQLDYLLEELCCATGFGYAEVWIRHRKGGGAQSWSEGRLSSDLPPARSSLDVVRNFINRRVNVLSRRSSQDMRHSVEASRSRPNLSPTQSRVPRPLGGWSQARPWHELANMDIGNIAQDDDENDADDADDERMRERPQFADKPLLSRCWPWGGHEHMSPVSAPPGVPEHVHLSSRSRPPGQVLLHTAACVCNRWLLRTRALYALYAGASTRVGGMSVWPLAQRPRAQGGLVS